MENLTRERKPNVPNRPIKNQNNKDMVHLPGKQQFSRRDDQNIHGGDSRELSSDSWARESVQTTKTGANRKLQYG